MISDEVFRNPTVREVHFELRFPNLFFIESKIGDFQLAIMEKFPQSKLVLRRHLVFADVGPEAKLQQLPQEIEDDRRGKVWQFLSGTGVEVNVMTSALGIHSSQHRTYNNPSVEPRFRDMIEFVISSFLRVTSLPVIERLGLRYIDVCPLPEKTNAVLQDYYNTAFPVGRFAIDDAEIMQFIALVKRNGFSMRYIEALQRKEKVDQLLLDFDASGANVKPEDYLSVTDRLHELISDEYNRTIKDPVRRFMRQDPTESGSAP
ncbi:MAG TPA: TIGR04255 family protein [Planctomycetota bacterium]|nr:TIGR04255 family protein [Planctomycetota bacterium]